MASSCSSLNGPAAPARPANAMGFPGPPVLRYIYVYHRVPPCAARPPAAAARQAVGGVKRLTACRATRLPPEEMRDAGLYRGRWELLVHRGRQDGAVALCAAPARRQLCQETQVSHALQHTCCRQDVALASLVLIRSS